MSKKTILQLLLKQHGVTMRFVNLFMNLFILCYWSLAIEFACMAMITQCKHKLDLKGGSATTKSIPNVIKDNWFLIKWPKTLLEWE
jgi:hypothetical protein